MAYPSVSRVTNTCTQEIKGQLTQSVGNDDPVKIRVGSSGQPVVTWCRTTDTLTTGAPPVPVVRVSFTNADTAVASNPPPIGYGWYDANPTQVHIGTSAIDPTSLATC